MRETGGRDVSSSSSSSPEAGGLSDEAFAEGLEVCEQLHFELFSTANPEDKILSALKVAYAKGYKRGYVEVSAAALRTTVFSTNPRAEAAGKLIRAAVELWRAKKLAVAAGGLEAEDAAEAMLEEAAREYEEQRRVPSLARRLRDRDKDLQHVNAVRQTEWDKKGNIDLSYRGNELAGEVGEAARGSPFAAAQYIRSLKSDSTKGGSK